MDIVEKFQCPLNYLNKKNKKNDKIFKQINDFVIILHNFYIYKSEYPNQYLVDRFMDFQNNILINDIESFKNLYPKVLTDKNLVIDNSYYWSSSLARNILVELTTKMCKELETKNYLNESEIKEFLKKYSKDYRNAYNYFLNSNEAAFRENVKNYIWRN